MKVLLDTNIVLDYILERSKFVEAARDIFRMAYNYEFDAFVSASSVTDIYYIVQKFKSKEEALNLLREILSFIGVAGVDKMVVMLAINSGFSDFEDAVQNFSAVNSSIDIIISRNTQDYKNSILLIFEPAQFLEYMQQKK